MQAIAEGRALFPDLELAVGSADYLPYPEGHFDIVIAGPRKCAPARALTWKVTGGAVQALLCAPSVLRCM